MNKITLLFGLLTLASCGRDDEKVCKCTSQRSEKTIIRSTIMPLPIISETEWEIVGSPKDAGTDCSKNGYNSIGNTANLIPGTTTSNERHWKEETICK